MFGLINRETKIARYVAGGHGTERIAATLAVSPHTVQDHMKAIFTKSGVRGRREFVAHLLAAGAPEVWT